VHFADLFAFGFAVLARTRVALSSAVKLSATSNVPRSVLSLVGKNLHRQRNHPLSIVKDRMCGYLQSPAYNASTPQSFRVFEELSPVVTVAQNFDELLTPSDHVSRSRNDTYYVDDTHVLRCHMTAHQGELLRAGHRRFLMVGDVYRCDTVDATHYPVFHQLDGVRLFQRSAEAHSVDHVVADMKRALEGMIAQIFGQVRFRWVDAYFPFTEPSFELEIWYRDEWLEVLGCGMMRQQIIDTHTAALPSAEQRDCVGWAFGIGLERIAMALYQVPDIRLFWSEDERFLRQFDAQRPSAPFRPYSKYPAVWHDVSMWVGANFHVNQVHELVRDVAGDLIEDVKQTDAFVHPRTQRSSNTFRLTFRHMDRSLTNVEIDERMALIRQRLTAQLGVELREASKQQPQSQQR
jgi:phenylalanyl-tRNA synthetase alpha chain